MNEARKNGTKPKIAPFRLSAKPSIKDAPIFEDIAYKTKKRPTKRLSTSKAVGNEELPVAELVTETLRPTENVFRKRNSSGGFGKILGDPLRYKVADPFSIMTAEPEEDEQDLTVQQEMESAKDEITQSDEKETSEECKPEAVAKVNEESDQSAKGESAESAKHQSAEPAKRESAQSAEMETAVSAKNELVNDIQDSLMEQDMLEINADIDSSTLRDTDDNIFEDNQAKQKDEKENEKKEKRHKKHKKSEKHGEKKKKRRKERNKSEDEGQDKHHKKSRRETRSRSRNRSRSRSSSKRRRRNRSEDRSLNKSRRDSNRRDSRRFGSHTSRSRSPIQRERSHGRNRISNSPKRRTREERSPLPSTSDAKTLPEKSPKVKTQREKSPKAKISKEKSPRRSSKGGKCTSPELPNRSKDKFERKSREEKSPKKNSQSRSPVESKRKKSEGDTFASTASPGKKEKIESEVEVKQSEIVSPNIHKSSSNGPQLKSYVKIVKKDPKPLVPYDDDLISISPRDSADGLNVFSEKEISIIPEAESQKSHKSKESKHRENDEGESGKKVKGKKKSKKSQEKKRKKKALAKSQALENAERNTDDELDDLLFTKTDKESKEDVFNDSDVFTAKHSLRTAVVDLDRKKTVGSPGRNENKLGHLRKEILGKKKASPLRKEPLKSKKLSSVVVHPKNSPDPIEPEKNSEISEVDVVGSENLPEPSALDEAPAQAGFSTIPFLSVDEEITGDVGQPAKGDIDESVEDYNIEEPIESERYSPVEQPMESNDAPYSPLEGPASDFGSPRKSSTMNLSDISTKDTVVQETLGIVTAAEKVEDFLGRIQPPEKDFGATDMDMSSPTNGMGANSDNDDIIEKLHKEFVRTQHQEDVQPSIYTDNRVPEASGVPQIPQYPKSTLSPLHTAANDPIVQAYGFNKKYSGLLKTKHSKRSKPNKVKNDKKESEPLDKEKKDIEDALNRVHRQARVEDEMKHALKVYFKRKDITKEEYKMILRKGVPQVANSNHTIDPERIRSLVKKYVAKYKGSRERHAEKHSNEQQDIPFTFSP